ncbi:MAG: T9SS type A sorting domain-containing protein [Chitinophagaceae bacterium]|nr:T9SS type A sorting domain-containing protein [Chitinophagaceae bacterium]
MAEKSKRAKGNNTVQLTGLNRYSNGVYTLQVFVNDEAVTQKLVLQK